MRSLDFIYNCGAQALDDLAEPEPAAEAVPLLL